MRYPPHQQNRGIAGGVIRPRFGVLLGILTLILTSPVAVYAKRGAPRPVPPVVWEGIEYRAPLDWHHMGCVQAFDVSSGHKLWETKIYHVWIMPLAEEDNQSVFISSMQIQGEKLLVTNENGNGYRLDLKTGRVEGRWLWWFLLGLLVLTVGFFLAYWKGKGIEEIPASN
jgi:hypothetical protein